MDKMTSVVHRTGFWDICISFGVAHFALAPQRAKVGQQT